MKHGVNHITSDAVEALEKLGVTVYKETEEYWSYTLDTREDHFNNRTWLHPDSRDYWFLIRGSIFRQVDELSYGYSTDPPTKYVRSSLYYPSDQDLYRSVLENRPPEVTRPI